MTNTFKNYLSKNITTAAATILTVAASTQTIVIGGSVANTTSGAITVDVYITSGGVDYYIVKNAPVPVGGTLVFGGGDAKIVLEATDALKIVSNTVTSADAVVNVLEIT